jgi:uncharacterized protein Yka (UPF0111/DUF47 family)
MSKGTEECEAQKEKLNEVLNDIKVLARDLPDHKQMSDYKKKIKDFENEIDHSCDNP